MSDHTTRRRFLALAGSSTAAALAGCTGGDGGGGDDPTDTMTEAGMNETMTEGTMTEGTMTEGGMEPTDPAMASRVTVDRFSEDAGTLHVRGMDNELPAAGEPIDFDESFLTKGYGPDGQPVEYYDFDVQPTAPAPIYAFFRENGDPVEDQLNVVGVVPGDEGYNDFWQVNKVTVPDEYEANTVTSASALMEADYDVETTNVIKNCPIVPQGSTASKRHGDGSTELVDGWYDGELVSYFLFAESPLETAGGSVPTSPIFVTFNTNPGEEGGGPPSGFMTEEMSEQTHNVVASLPEDAGYSPLWMVNVYDNADFDSVSDIDSATDANVLGTNVATVNCPIVSGM